jgi:hypothetical protein
VGVRVRGCGENVLVLEGVPVFSYPHYQTLLSQIGSVVTT